MGTRWIVGLAIASMMLWSATATAQTAEKSVTFPERSSPTAYVVDAANLLTPEHAATIQKTASALVKDHQIPIVVVSIQSMAAHGIAGQDIASYARTLFDDWGIGHSDWNRGILLVVSVDDRKARIELGADWRHTRQAATERVMQDQLVPRFKAGKYSLGIVASVMALDNIARDWAGGADPDSPTAARRTDPPPSYEDDSSGSSVWLVILCSLLGTLVLTWHVRSMYWYGTSGGAWRFWSTLFRVTIRIWFAFLRASDNSSSGRSSSWGGGSGSSSSSSYSSSSSWGGGSSSGGSGGGGGSTGSW